MRPAATTLLTLASVTLSILVHQHAAATVVRRKLPNQSRIFGGANADPGIVARTAELAIRDAAGKLYGCTAFVIRKNWVLTAAHCVVGENYERATAVRVTVGGTHHDADLVRAHADYTPDPLEHDIALIRLSSSIDGFDTGMDAQR